MVWLRLGCCVMAGFGAGVAVRAEPGQAFALHKACSRRQVDQAATHAWVGQLDFLFGKFDLGNAAGFGSIKSSFALDAW